MELAFRCIFRVIMLEIRENSSCDTIIRELTFEIFDNCQVYLPSRIQRLELR
jgi:hypothetical protein